MRKLCSVPGCDRPASKHKTLCGGHRIRKIRTGDVQAHIPLKSYRPSGSGCVHSGYILDTLPGHPLAYASGRVLRHRVVLYDTIGPGQHPCHWCRAQVTWGVDLQPDHLDGDKLNNEPSNLVPSCPSCNGARGALGNPTDWRAT